MIFRFYTGNQNPCELQFGNPPKGFKWYIDFLDIQKKHTARTADGTITLYTSQVKSTVPTEILGNKQVKQAGVTVHWQDMTQWINNEGTEAIKVHDHHQWRIEQFIQKNMNFIGIYTDAYYYGYAWGFVILKLVPATLKQRFGDLD